MQPDAHLGRPEASSKTITRSDWPVATRIVNTISELLLYNMMAGGEVDGRSTVDSVGIHRRTVESRRRRRLQHDYMKKRG